MFYYTVTYCIIYEKSAVALVESSLLSLFLAWFVVEIGTQVVQAGLRELAKKYPALKYLYFIY